MLLGTVKGIHVAEPDFCRSLKIQESSSWEFMNGFLGLETDSSSTGLNVPGAPLSAPHRDKWHLWPTQTCGGSGGEMGSWVFPGLRSQEQSQQ